MDRDLNVGNQRLEDGDQALSLVNYSERVAEQPAKIRILVLDEQPLVRYGVSAYLNSQPDMMVCGEADSIPGAESKIAEYQPQLLVTELRVGAGDSPKLLKQLKAKNRALRILVYSASEESIFAERVLRAGASGYLMKQAPSEKLASAIREIVKGGIYVSREVGLKHSANHSGGRTIIMR
jgi:DNA-binding NarL/FixJ family response regulator